MHYEFSILLLIFLDFVGKLLGPRVDHGLMGQMGHGSRLRDP